MVALPFDMATFEPIGSTELPSYDDQEMCLSVFGQPTKKGVNEWRWGKKGSKCLYIDTRFFIDHETDERFWPDEFATEFGFAGTKELRYRAPAVTDEQRRIQKERQEQQRVEKTKRAQAIWQEAVPIEGTPAEAYLKRRTGVSTGGLRYHEDGAFMVAPLYDDTGGIQAIHRTYIETRDKLHLGSCDNHFVDLGYGDSKFVVVGEGIETTLALMARTGITRGRAGFSTSGLQKMPTHGIEIAIIACDNDDAGIKAAKKAKDRFQTAFILLPKGPKGTDWADMDPVVNAPPQRIQDVFQRCEVFLDHGSDPCPESEPLGLLDRFSATASCYQGKPEPIRWLFCGAIPRGVPIILAGEGGLGKTRLAFHLAATVTGIGGVPWYFQASEQGDAVFMTAEDDLASVHRMFYDLDPTGNARSSMPHKFSVVPLTELNGDRSIMRETKSGIEFTDFYNNLKQDLIKAQPALIVFDPLLTFLCGDVNRQDIAQAFMSEISSLAAQTGATVLITHHVTKSKNNSLQEIKHSITGSAQIVNGARGAIAMWRKEDDTSGIHIAVVKSNFPDADTGPKRHVRQNSWLSYQKDQPEHDHQNETFDDDLVGELVRLVEQHHQKYEADGGRQILPLSDGVNGKNSVYLNLPKQGCANLKKLGRAKLHALVAYAALRGEINKRLNFKPARGGTPYNALFPIDR